MPVRRLFSSTLQNSKNAELLKNKPYSAFTLHSFDNHEQNLMFVKTDFKVLKLKFYACSMKLTFYLLHKQNIDRTYGAFLLALIYAQ